MKTKFCSKCKKEKSLEDFSIDHFTRIGRRSHCKKCCNKTARKRYWKNPKKARTDAKNRYKNRNLQKTKKRYRKKDLKKKFGITIGKYDEMFENQNGVCAICNKPETAIRQGLPANLAIDHDHQTGQIRGLLCARCNTMIGLAKENITTLTHAISYLIQAKMPKGK